MIAKDAFLTVLHQTATEYKLTSKLAFVVEPVVARIVIGPSGEFYSVEKVENAVLPRRVYAVQDKKSPPRFLVEKPDRILQAVPSQNLFAAQIEAAFLSTKDKGLKSVLNFLKSLSDREQRVVASEVQKSLGAKNKYAEVTFSIYGKNRNTDVFNVVVRRWWKQEFQRQIKERFKSSRRGFCQVTCKREIIPDCSPFPVSGMGAIISANNTAFEYSGYNRLSCSHVGLSAAMNIAVSLSAIANNTLEVGQKSKNTRFSIDKSHCILSWFTRLGEVTVNDEKAVSACLVGLPPLLSGMLPSQEDWSYIDWIKQKYAGTESANPDPNREHDYCALLVENNMGRLVIQELASLTLHMLRGSITQWDDDLSLSCRPRGRRKLLSVSRVMHMLAGPNAKVRPSHICKAVYRAFFLREGLPAKQLVALNRAVVTILKKGDGALWDTIALIKMVLLRKGITMPTGWTLEKAQTSPAFAIGGILFLVAYAQHPETRGRNSVIPSRFLSMCGTNPQRASFVLGRYFEIYTKRLTKEKPKLAYALRRAYDHMRCLAGDWPKTMTNEQRSEFVVGFSMLREALATPKKLSDVFPHLSQKENDHGDQE